MDGRPSIISGLKAKHFQHILDLSQGDFSSSQSSSSSEGNVRQGRPTTPECTCPCRPRVEESTCPRDEHPRDITASGIGHVRAPLHLPDDGALAEEALGMLSPAEKDEVILRMHAKLRHLGGLVEEASTTSARTAARLARTHTDALREQMLSEQRLNEELLRWRHHHPEHSSSLYAAAGCKVYQGYHRVKTAAGACTQSYSTISSQCGRGVELNSSTDIRLFLSSSEPRRGRAVYGRSGPWGAVGHLD
eukprot:g6787.t1